MPIEPPIKRAVAFVDGQNLFYAGRNAFGYTFPNYDVAALAAAVCQQQNWNLTQRVILEIYDALAASQSTGQPYATRLDPPPADPKCCHPPR